MRGGVLHHYPSVRPAKSLVARGGLVRTFGGLASFLAVTFLFWGVYILEDAFANPIAAQAAAVIAGAFIVALAAILIFYLIKPGKRPRKEGLQRPHDAASPAEEPFFRKASLLVREEHPHRDLTYQRFYVDRSRIRP